MGPSLVILLSIWLPAGARSEGAREAAGGGGAWVAAVGGVWGAVHWAVEGRRGMRRGRLVKDGIAFQLDARKKKRAVSKKKEKKRRDNWRIKLGLFLNLSAIVFYFEFQKCFASKQDNKQLASHQPLDEKNG
jgi:hypothetical protein